LVSLHIRWTNGRSRATRYSPPLRLHSMETMHVATPVCRKSVDTDDESRRRGIAHE
jgi:hypothetical protein